LDPLPLLTTWPTDTAHAAPRSSTTAGRTAWRAGWPRPPRQTGVRTVALGGGCFLNALLTTLLVPQLQAEQGLHVLQARRHHPTTAPSRSGQAWVAHCANASWRLKPCAWPFPCVW
jgi:hypothetical protein